MIIKNTSFEQFAAEVKKKHLKIIVFGTGVLGKVTAVEIIKEYQLEKSVDCYIDNDVEKHNTDININNKTFQVYPVDVLAQYNETQVAILLAISRCGEVLEQLSQFSNLENTSCYLLPMMCISNFKNSSVIEVTKESVSPKIPKVIHYMWLGKKEIPSYLEKCIDSWKKYCPDYEIKRWDETNYDINKELYMQEAYNSKMYGFVPDYARLDILYQYGGIYMDTDVELIKSLDDLLYQEAFCGVEKWQTLNFGGCSGAVKGSLAIQKMLEARKNILFIDKNGKKNMNTCGYYDTQIAINYGYCFGGKKQKILDMTIYPYDFFHPYDYMSGKLDITENTYSIHHFNGGWLDKNMKSENKKIQLEYDRIFELAKKNKPIFFHCT